MSINDDWARGYARQADADLRAWELYQRHPESVAATCHQLLFLQMACEKLCKAYLIKDGTLAPNQARKSHGYVGKNLPTILRQEISYQMQGNLAQMRAVMGNFRHLAQEIEILNPAMNRDARPDNCEYPWDAGGYVVSPLDWAFQPAGLLSVTQPSGRTFLKSLRLAINRVQ